MNMLTVEKQQFDLLVHGELIGAASGKYFELVNPSTGEAFARVADATAEDIKKAISSTLTEFNQGTWRNMSVAERGIYLRKIADLIRKHAKELADLESANIGKTLKQSSFIDVPTAADCFEYFGSLETVAKDRQNSVTDQVKSLTTFEPMGVVSCIIPWNYPLIMAAWKMAPALIAGNAVILKPSSVGCASVMRLAQIVKEAGLPAGILNVVATTNKDAARLLVTDKDVDMVSFTGGTQTGQEIMRLASQTTKKLSLELGGKSPNIVFGDCDLETAVGGTMSAIFMNQGQMCTAGSRLLLEESIYDKFMKLLVEKTKKLKIGNALDYQTEFGPVVSKEQQAKALQYIEEALKQGAKVICGGKIPQDEKLKKGFFLEPTILENVTNKMSVAQEEIFGPVLAVIKFKGEQQAVSIANDSDFGLAACVWTKDLIKADRVAKQLQTGTVWINTYGGFYNAASFGGYKQSGFGRELGHEGLLEYMQSKHICTDQTPGGKPLVANWF
ncbi:MAG: aldehyde dehydrogenase family protein [Candidatus Omnitrophica bacterium]|nr:aldehyde dehydrogenase family protein [Candidatus Omnitrophota bacterium]